MACNESMSNNVIVVGEDSDLLVLLLYYSTFYDSAFNLTFKSDLTKSKYPKAHNIFRYRDVLGPNPCDQLLFVHGFSGCDTTSLFSILVSQLCLIVLLIIDIFKICQPFLQLVAKAISRKQVYKLC